MGTVDSSVENRVAMTPVNLNVKELNIENI